LTFSLCHLGSISKQSRWSDIEMRAQRASENAFRSVADPAPAARPALYTADERKRRDESIWTLVQGVLAPVQFLIFLVSLALVLRYLATGEGAVAATVSIVVKTLALYTIMITGSIWEKVVFGKWLFARPFYWEDMFSMIVLALHTAYLVSLAMGWGSTRDLMLIALAGYAAYVVNAGQFILKLRMARLDHARMVAG
jgi:3-vinyl bacteriochlorophyllide hydratase